MDKHPVLESDRLYFRPIVDADIDHIYRGLSDPEVIKYYGVNFMTREATKEQMIWYADLEKNETGIWWAICLKSDDRFLGAAGLNDLSRQHKKAELGFWLLPENWGKGIMSESIPVLLAYCFAKLELHRIEAFVDSENHNSKNLLEKLHFNYEGTMVDCEIKNGAYISLDNYATFN